MYAFKSCLNFIQIKGRFVFRTCLFALIFIPCAKGATVVSPPELSDFQVRFNLAQKLGFISTNLPLCGGYYQEELIIPPSTSQKISVTANQALFIQNAPSRLEGDVKVQKQRQLAEAQSALLNTNAKTGKIESIRLFGNVSIKESGKYLIGENAYISIKDQKAEINNTLYRFHLEREDHRKPIGVNHIQLLGNVAWGKANSICQLKNNQYLILDTTMTTCPPTINHWHITAKKIDLQQDKGRGYAYHTVFWIKHVPIFYTPYLSFPLDNRRQSGFLVSTPGFSKRSGYEIDLSYYFNLAPNYDLTLSPHIYSKRGIMVESEFRYLSKKSQGKLNIDFIPYDKLFNQKQSSNDLLKKSRTYIHFKHKTQFSQHWTSSINFTRVSDDNYLHDFFNSAGDYQMNQLLQQADVRYQNLNWMFLARLQAYQTLNPPGFLSTSPVYQRLPMLALNANFPKANTQLSFHWNNEFDRFVWPGQVLNGYWKLINRLNTQPTLTWHVLDKPYGFFKPQLCLHATHYEFHNNGITTYSNKNRIIPITSIDSGINLQISQASRNSQWIQTIVPRIKYVFIPYRDQSKISLIDSSYYLFNFDQLFRENRFSGIDRVGDTHHLSLSLLTQFKNTKSFNIPLQIGIGQIIYFRPREVGLCTEPNCNETKFVGYTPSQEPLSPSVAFISWTPHPKATVSSDLSWHITRKEPYIIRTNLQFHPTNRHLFNLSYSYIRNGDSLVPTLVPTTNTTDLGQFNTSFFLSLTPNWSAYGALTYNHLSQNFRTYFAGLEYNSCCWATRFLVGRSFVALNNQLKPVYNPMIYIQIALKGLGYYHNDNLNKLLATHIPGFKDNI